jgi:hypothetical protein
LVAADPGRPAAATLVAGIRAVPAG